MKNSESTPTISSLENLKNQEKLMLDELNTDYNNLAWIPLRVYDKSSYSDSVYCKLGSAMVLSLNRDKANSSLDWGDVSKMASSYCLDGEFVPAEEIRFLPKDPPIGIRLVLDQWIESECYNIWHLHPDLIIALNLVRNEDTWTCVTENNEEVVKLSRDSNNEPLSIYIKNKYLKDYLCARNSYLAISVYSEKYVEFEIDEAGKILEEYTEHPLSGFTWEIQKIEDRYLKRLYARIAYWANYTVKKGTSSPRVRGDEEIIHKFIATKEGSFQTLPEIRKNRISHLFFEPTVLPNILASTTKSKINWTSQETGILTIFNTYPVTWGISELGKITVYAGDLEKLPNEIQRRWVSFSIDPDDEISSELYSAQMQQLPASTTAPEDDLISLIINLDSKFKEVFGAALFNPSATREPLIKGVSRFEAVLPNGLLILALNLWKVVVDRLDKKTLKKVLADLHHRPSEENLGSLKLLDILITKLQGSNGNTGLDPLFVTTELRNKVAHPKDTEISKELGTLQISESISLLAQGRLLISKNVEALQIVMDEVSNYQLRISCT